MFEPPSGGGIAHDVDLCGEKCPPHKHLIGKPQPSCQRPSGHNGNEHQVIRKRDFQIVMSWADGAWVSEPPEPKK